MNTPIIRQNSAAWNAGYDAAIAGKPQYPAPGEIQDTLAFVGGWIEGNADFALARQIVRLPPEQRKIIDALLYEQVTR